MNIAIVRVKDSLWGNMPNGVKSISPYKKFNLFTRICIKYFERLKIIQPLIYNRELKNTDAEVLIVFDSISKHFLRWLKKHNKNTRIVLWYWNPVFLTLNPDDVPSGIEKWSYSRTDCEQYGMKFNTQFCFDNYTKQLLDMPVEYDLFFLGRDKGRAKLIDELKNISKSKGLKSEFFIIEKGAYQPYSEVLVRTAKSKCLLDICVKDDVGMSLRALEALFLNKKVITNNKMYVYEKFYNKQNVFILDVDDINGLSEFINSSFEPISKEIKEEYLFESWIQRFLV